MPIKCVISVELRAGEESNLSQRFWRASSYHWTTNPNSTLALSGIPERLPIVRKDGFRAMNPRALYRMDIFSFREVFRYMFPDSDSLPFQP